MNNYNVAERINSKVNAKLKLTDPLFVVYSKRSPVVGVGAQASMGLAFPSML